MRTTPVLFAAAFGRTALAATCDAPVAPDAVVAEVDAAMAALATLDTSTFEQHLKQADGLIPCVDAVFTPAQSAAIHRAQALLALAQKDQTHQGAALRTARVLEPDFDWASVVSNPRHPILQVWPSLPRAAARAPLPPPAEGVELWFDGTVAADRPPGDATLMQVTSPQTPVVSAYLWPDQDPLPYLKRQVEPGGSDKKKRCRTPLLVATGAAAALTAGSQAGTFIAIDRFESVRDTPGSTFEDAQRARSLVNGLVVTTAGAATATLGLGTGAIVCMAW